MNILRISILVSLGFLIFLLPAVAQGASDEFFKGTIIRAVDDPESAVPSFVIRLPDGQEVIAEYAGSQTQSDPYELFSEGDRVVVAKNLDNLELPYYLIEHYRFTSLIWIALLFVFVVLVVGRRRGLTSLAGLAVSVCIIVFFIVPQIADGKSPLVIALIGSIAIALFSITTSHGISRRTFIAVGSTIVTLVFSVFFALLVVEISHVFGLGSEDAYYLQFGLLGTLNFKGLLLAGILIGTLGVLDDVTTTQTATVDELLQANSSLSIKDVVVRAMSVGREHIASLVNTLALAYLGVALPLILTFTAQEGIPLWTTLNSEGIAEEIVRTVVGSTALILAVPISTYLAAYFLKKKPVDKLPLA